MRIEPTFSRLPEGEVSHETRALVPVLPAPITLPSFGGELKRESIENLREISSEYDVRYITPREMVDLSFDLYVTGFVSREQYRDLAFQSELMPNFDATIGALTGERADPDRPRDYTAIWRARLEFENQYGADEPRIVERTAKILELLQSLKSAQKGLLG